MISLIACLLLLASPDDPKSVVPVVVRSTEIDVNGHVNNAKGIEYLQWGRWDWLERNGFGRGKVAEAGIVLAVVRIEADYRREMREGDALSVSTAPVRVGEKSFDFRQTIHRGNELAMEAKITIVVIDGATRKARPIPDDLRARLTDNIKEEE